MQVLAKKKPQKKRVQNGLKLKHGTSTQEGHSTLLECWLAQIVGMAWGLLDWDKSYPFQFFKDKDASQIVFWSLS